jgi:hypothetical protein
MKSFGSGLTRAVPPAMRGVEVSASSSSTTLVPSIAAFTWAT